jgi:hypothetical protein
MDERRARAGRATKLRGDAVPVCGPQPSERAGRLVALATRPESDLPASGPTEHDGPCCRHGRGELGADPTHVVWAPTWRG